MGRNRSSRIFTSIFYILATAVCLLVYRRIADNYLYNDDFRWMSQARYDMRPGNILTFEVVGFFRPLMNLIFYVTERLMPGNIGAYYTTSLVLHLLNGVLVFHFLAQLTGRRVLAAGTALFFLVTSTHWGAVGWISASSALISTALLLLSLWVVTNRPRVRWRRWLAVALYAMALAAKEDVVTGVLLVGLLFVLRDRNQDTLPDRRTLVYFAATAIVYVMVRSAVIGHVTQDNWGPGWHALRNLAGGLLYNLYPWGLSTLTGIGDEFAVSVHPLWPEILAIPALALVAWAGHVLGRGREVIIALGWILIALLPASLFKFRFFTTDWLTHDRYYYLSSIGACFCIASLLAGLWSAGRFRVTARAAVLATMLVIAAGEPVAVANREGRFRRMTMGYQGLVTVVGRRLDAASHYSTCAIQDWPMQAGFMRDVFALERPSVRFVAVSRPEDATAYRPCLYVRILIEGNRLGSEAATVE